MILACVLDNRPSPNLGLEHQPGDCTEIKSSTLSTIKEAMSTLYCEMLLSESNGTFTEVYQPRILECRSCRIGQPPGCMSRQPSINESNIEPYKREEDR